MHRRRFGCAKGRKAGRQCPSGLHPGFEGAGEPRASEGPRAPLLSGKMTQVELLQHTGFRRVGLAEERLPVRWAPLRDVRRLRSLRIPPAWTDVAVNRDPRAKLLAVGRDKKGAGSTSTARRRSGEREQRKYEKLIAFGRALFSLAAGHRSRHAPARVVARAGDGVHPAHPLHLLHAPRQPGVRQGERVIRDRHLAAASRQRAR